MHTETNVFDPAEAPRWLWKQWFNVLRMREHGVPVLGFTWYSLIDQIDWDVGLAEQRGTINRCGLYGLDRRPNPVALDFRELIAEYGDLEMMPVQSMGDLAEAA
jgi:beta-glucosidase/6-phospho-beta-glucosidase/beta-galactosidase